MLYTLAAYLQNLVLPREYFEDVPLRKRNMQEKADFAWQILLLCYLKYNLKFVKFYFFNTTFLLFIYCMLHNIISYLTYCVRSNHEMVIMDPYNRFILWCFFRHSPKSIQRYGSKLLIDSPFLINCLITYSSSYFLLIISIEHMSPFSIDLTCRLANTLR